MLVIKFNYSRTEKNIFNMQVIKCMRAYEKSFPLSSFFLRIRIRLANLGKDLHALLVGHTIIYIYLFDCITTYFYFYFYLYVSNFIVILLPFYVAIYAYCLLHKILCSESACLVSFIDIAPQVHKSEWFNKSITTV